MSDLSRCVASRPSCRTTFRVASTLAVFFGFGLAATAAPLDPNAFASLGTLSPGAGTFTANTGGTPTLVVGGTTFTGVVVSQGAGLPEIAVFTFDGVAIGNGVTIRGLGTRPMAILSKGNITFAGTGTVTAAVGGAGAGQPTANAGGGPGGGGGGDTFAGGGGGGFGGDGGRGGGINEGGSAGVAYGEIGSVLQGGSAGGRGDFRFAFGGAGGAGGGGLELGAIGTISIASTTVLDVRGGAGENAPGGDVGGGGGGSGGGLLLHAGNFALPAGSTLRAAGGSGGAGTGFGGGAGGGGGGRIAARTDTFVTGSVLSTVDVAGGAGGAGGPILSGTSGVAGTAGASRFEANSTVVSSGTVFGFSAGGFAEFGTRDLTVQSGGVAAKAGDYANPGTVTVQSGGLFSASGLVSGGTYRLEGGALVASGGTDLTGATLEGRGTVISRVTGSGGTLRAVGGTLTIGDANRTDAIDFDGTITIGDLSLGTPAGLVLLDANRALIGDTTLINGSTLSAPNGTTLRAGAQLGAGIDTFVNGAFTNDGTVAGPNAAGEFLTFTDDVTGAGSYAGNVLFSDGFSPGNSPAEVSFGSVAFDATAELLIELGGLVAGTEFDLLKVAGDALLGGELVVDLINGFLPSAGHEFLFLDIAGMRSGTFAGLGEGALVGNFGGTDLFVTYQAGDGNDVALFAQPAAVPEPSSLALLTLVGLGAAGYRRWRQPVAS